MKRLINSNKKCMLMVVRKKDAKSFDAFKGCNPSHRKEIFDLISNYDEIFQEPSGLPPKREI